MSGDAIAELTRRLVRARSENPPGDTTAPIDIVAAELEAAGFTVERVESGPGLVGVVGEYAFRTPGRTLMLNGHVDVVPAGDLAGWTHDPFAGEVVDGRLYGRGSLDMKGPLAALIVAAREAVSGERPLAGRLKVSAVPDEESGGFLGSGALVEAGKAGADAVVIAEPADGGIVVAHRGMCFLRLVTRGRSAHASMPENGVNAVEKMVDVLTALRTVELAYEPHPLLGRPGLAVGTMIEGGRKINMIPDECRATVDVRLVPGMTPAGVVDELRAHCEASGAPVPEVEIVVGGEAGETDPDAEIVRLAAEAFEQEFGHRPEVRGIQASTDGWWFANRVGVPAIMAFGPGGIAGCHIDDEHVDLVELERYGRVYADLIGRFLAP